MLFLGAYHLLGGMSMDEPLSE